MRQRILPLLLTFVLVCVGACSGGGTTPAGVKPAGTGASAAPASSSTAPGGSQSASKTLAGSYSITGSLQPGQIVVLRIGGVTVADKPDQTVIMVYTAQAGDTATSVLS